MCQLWLVLFCVVLSLLLYFLQCRGSIRMKNRYFEILMCLGRSDCNYAEARLEYLKNYAIPRNLRQPTWNTFARLHGRVSTHDASTSAARIDRMWNRLLAPFLKNAEGIAYTTKVAIQAQEVKSWKEIPGPSSLPIIGPMHNFLPGGKLAGYRGIHLCERLYKLYGPIVKLDKIVGGYDTIFLFDPEAVGQVCRSEDPMPVRPGFPSLTYYRQRHNKTYDPKRLTGLGTDDGENWKRFRTMLNPIMMNPKTIRKLYSGVLEEIADEMIMRLRSIRDENNKITKKLNMEMNLWALESIGMVALGTRLHCFSPDLPSDSPVARLIRVATDVFNVADELDFSPSLWRLFATPKFKRGMQIYEEHERITKFFIDKARENYKQRKSPLSEAEKPVLEKLLDIDVEMANIVAKEFLLGGFDTTANAVITTLYLLATNLEKQEKLREEVLSKDSKKTYLRACIKESLRVQPVFIGNVRQVTKEYNLLGYHIPKNVQIFFAQNYISVTDEHYPRATEFIPERWLVDQKDPLNHGNTHPFVSAPWGYGVRMCLGRRLAELEIETMVSKVIANFHVDWSSAEPIQMAPTILNYVKEPLHFVFKNLPDTSRVQ